MIVNTQGRHREAAEPQNLECIVLMLDIMITNTLRLWVSLAALVGAQSSQAALFQYEASLSGAAENPPVPSPGTGLALVTYDTAAHTLRVQVSFADLVGPTTVAHIHAPVDPPGNVGVAVQPGTLTGFPAGVTSGTYDGTFSLLNPATYTANFLNSFGGGSPAGGEAALAGALADGRAYLNIHTTFRPGGEIRGFLSPVPDISSTASLLLVAVFGLLGWARRERARIA